MTKEKLKSLVKLRDNYNDRLIADIPPKHIHRGRSYKLFLENEIRLLTLAIEQLKLGGTK